VEIHGKDTRNNLDFYVTPTNLTICQKGIYYMGQTIFNSLRSNIKDKTDNGRELVCSSYLRVCMT
jgi:hypothetical protein